MLIKMWKSVIRCLLIWGVTSEVCVLGADDFQGGTIKFYQSLLRSQSQRW